MDLEILIFFLDEANELLSSWERICIDLEKDPSPDNLNQLFRMAHNLKGSSRSVGLKDFGELIHKTEDLINLLRNDNLKVDEQVVDILLQVHSSLVSWIDALKKNPEHKHDYAQLMKKLSQYNASSLGKEKPSTSSSNQEAKSTNLDLLKTEILLSSLSPNNKNSVGNANTEAVAQVQKDENIRVSSLKLDQLITLVGELAVSQSMVYHGIRAMTREDRAMQSAIVTSYKVTREIQNVALSLRTQNLKTSFQRLERVIRDVAGVTNKKVNVKLSGENIELDKNVIEKITDALIHSVRNAVDHGIEEKVEDRIAAGKSELAQISIEASQSAAAVTISISDDGRGLNTDIILKKAIEKNLISADAKLTEMQIYDLLFLPGFSTAKTLTDISGRGVGLDVVKQSVEKLRGKITVNSKLNKGTTFKIELPTSLSIVDAIIISMGEDKFAVQVHELEEIVDLNSKNIEWHDELKGMIEIRGEVIPVIRLEKILSESNNESTERAITLHQPGMIINSNSKKILFTFNQILGQQQIVIRPLDKKLQDVFGISGSAILRDGEPGLILDLPKIANTFININSMTKGAA